MHGYRITGILAAVVLIPLVGCWGAGLVDVHRVYWLLTLFILPFWPWAAARSLVGAPPNVERVSLALRVVLSLALSLALADVRFVKGDRSLSVIFVLDYSASIPDDAREEQLDYVNAAAKRLPSGDRAGLVVFGENASVEVVPTSQLVVERLYADVRTEFTNVQQALELAAAAFPASGRRKIVLMTDGNENAGSVVDAAESLAAEGIALDLLPLRRKGTPEILIDNLIVPEEVRDGELFEVRARIMSHTPGPAETVFLRDDEVVARKSIDLVAGSNTVRFTTSVRGGGFHGVKVRVSGKADTLTGNNEHSGVVFVRGPARVLVVAPSPGETAALREICRDAGVVVTQVLPEEVPSSPVELYSYDCVVFANVPASNFTADSLVRLEVGVRELGMGLIMTGGEDSYAAGGWDGTPIADLLPVSLQPNRKREMPKGALVLILHTCEFPNGNYWAKEISKASLRTLSAQDEAGLIYFSNEQNDTWLFPLTSMSEEPVMRQLIDGCVPGDMISFAPSFKLATEGLTKSDAASRHLIVISDGDPSKPAATDVLALMAAQITVSTVAVNPHSPRDLEIMKNLAKKTGGRYYLVEDPRTLPSVFIREARRVQRGTIIQDPFRPGFGAESVLTQALLGARLPLLYGRVATSAKEKATTALVTTDEFRDPVLAHWQYGLGRVTAFTSDAGAAWSREWSRWDRGTRMWRSILEWTSRPGRSGDLELATRTDGDRGIVTIDAISEDGRYRNNLEIRGSVASGNDLKPVTVSRIAPGRYRSEFALGGVGVNVMSLSWRDPETGAQGLATAAITVPYPPEYRVFSANMPVLHEAANMGGGRILAGDPERDPIYAAEVKPLRSPLLLYGFIAILATGAFFIDVTVRRLVVRKQDLEALAEGLSKRKEPVARDDAVARLRAGKREQPPVAVPKMSPTDAPVEDDAFSPDRPESVVSSDPDPDRPVSESKSDLEEKGDGDDENGQSPGYTSRLLAAKRRNKKR